MRKEQRDLVTVLVVIMILLNSVHAIAVERSATSSDLEFFEKEVRPLLVEHCYSCHSGASEKLQASLRVDSRTALLKGGDSGPAILPGNADGSLFIEAVRYESYEMPPKGKLADSEIKTLEKWIEMGAPWPTEDVPVESGVAPAFDLHQRKSEHWAWQPVKMPTPPAVERKDWPHDPLDYFVLAKLEERGLNPTGDTDRASWVRRLYLDLIGLPPTPEQLASAIGDNSHEVESESSLERLVDALLDSPHFGERWGRHWLDLVRYAESRGHEFDNDAPNAFQYRDYVIRALNADVPYDQFVREHIAGDLLISPRLNPELGFNESILGTGFWFLGEWIHSPVDIRKDETDRLDNMIDVMSKTFLGMTVACARCHDHKFDAISTADYYSLSGFLLSSEYRQVRFESIEKNRHVSRQLAELDAKYQQQIRNLLDDEGITRPTRKSDLTDEAIIVDYSNIAPSLYMQDGFIFGQSPRQEGDAYLDDSNSLRIATRGVATSDPFWDGLESVTLGHVQDQNRTAKLPMSGRTLRTPTFELTDGRVSALVQGTGHVVACVDSHRLVAGPLHGETIKGIGAKAPGWVTLDLKRYVGHRLHLEFVPGQDSQLAIRMVVQGLDDSGLAEIDQRLSATDRPFEDYARAAEVVLVEKGQQIVDDWRRERSELRSQVVFKSHVAPAMMDGSGEEGYILIRGNSSKPGKKEPRHFLTAVSGETPMKIPEGSGRRELAEQINHPDNPLTSRVIVNRLWHHLMGRGIVPTTDDFGVLGQRPSHPELLDYLASEFVRDGQSLKRMIRRIVLSRTYQMSSQAVPMALEIDPKNILWHHRPPKRLEGEAIRDSLLAISGGLDTKPFGAPVPIHLTPFMEGRGRPETSGPLDGDGRRSIYIAVRRNFLSPFMLTFDTPVPFSTMGRRNVSNVPSQSLILMNDPFVMEQAKKWAEGVLERGESVEANIQRMYESAFARKPSERETEIAMKFLGASPTGPNDVAGNGTPPVDLERWIHFAHALVNTKEFVFLR